ncbi:hypothetical protein QR680_005430 [Steinernema hermaphroditum]|uniref:ENPP1-3/EXOG-like endonuclease/phosphodiesterase domain-containing protein n=1 Tax=Steinernema hermaphroditum TaxID=289476 RepID=A0AA39HS19_9BILA|nr:hypothetical protein QR680_005430 [Steinernema hermaphroditum]
MMYRLLRVFPPDEHDRRPSINSVPKSFPLSPTSRALQMTTLPGETFRMDLKDSVVSLERPKSEHHRLKLILLGTVAFLLLLVAIALVVLIFVLITRSPEGETTEFYNLDRGWQASCQRRCSKKFSTPPLLLISFDGFQAGYLSRNLSPAIKSIFDCGSKADYIFPSYPSITFPNHYTIITGLYPESHGIVTNAFFDGSVRGESTFTKGSKNPDWYGGEPLWNTLRKQGRNASSFFWPGSEVPIQGMPPPAFLPYNSTVPFSQRVDQVVKWLLDPSGEMSFISIYFDEPDSSGHQGGPISDKVNSAIIYVDAMLNYLMSELDRNGLVGCVNVVIVSDHGMQSVREDQKVYYDDFLDISDPNVKVFDSSIGRVQLVDEAKTNLSALLSSEFLKCQKGDFFRVYDRHSTPMCLHYTDNKRIGAILLDPSEGTEFYIDRGHPWSGKGDHGYDNRLKSMRAIFGAFGPSIRSGVTVPPFQNIELYNFFANLLELPISAPNNGTKGTLDTLLVNPPKREETNMTTVPDCEEQPKTFSCGHVCPTVEFARSASGSCRSVPKLRVPSVLSNDALCAIDLCNASLLFDRRLKSSKMAVSILDTPIRNVDHRSDCRIAVSAFSNEEHLRNCSEMNRKPSLILFSDDDDYRFVVDAQLQADPKFVKPNGIWEKFLKLIKKYRKHYRRLIMFSGPIYNFNSGRNAPSEDDVSRRSNASSPTHIFVILFRCADGLWTSSGVSCSNPGNSRVISFLLPTIPEDYNCLDSDEYLFHHTARVRDIELATGLEFFADRDLFDAAMAIRLRTALPEELWQRELSER